jgi:creatinine amidohydrolase
MNELHRYRLAALTYEETASRLARGVWALLPCGATEAHGPHLPLSTDVLISEHGALCAARLLAAEGVHALVLPAIAYGVTEYAAEFAGTISLPPETSRALVRDVIMGTVRSGFQGVVLCNAHLEPANIAALHSAVADAVERGVLAAFPDVTRKPHALRLGEEFRSGACHAGRYETSLVMAADPFVVRDRIAEHLDDNPISLSRAIRDGKATFGAAGGPRAYFGDPAQATSAEGEEHYRALADIFAAGVRSLRAASAVDR